MLPILCFMDLFSLRAFRSPWARNEIRIVVPASIIGIAAGTLLFEHMSTTVTRLLLGTVALLFVVSIRLIYDGTTGLAASVGP